MFNGNWFSLCYMSVFHSFTHLRHCFALSYRRGVMYSMSSNRKLDRLSSSWKRQNHQNLEVRLLMMMASVISDRLCGPQLNGAGFHNHVLYYIIGARLMSSLTIELSGTFTNNIKCCMNHIWCEQNHFQKHHISWQIPTLLSYASKMCQCSSVYISCTSKFYSLCIWWWTFEWQYFSCVSWHTFLLQCDIAGHSQWKIVEDTFSITCQYRYTLCMTYTPHYEEDVILSVL